MASLGSIVPGTEQTTARAVNSACVESEGSRTDAAVAAVYIRVHSKTQDSVEIGFSMEEEDTARAEAATSGGAGSDESTPLSLHEAEGGCATRGDLSSLSCPPRPVALEAARGGAGGAVRPQPAASGGGSSGPSPIAAKSVDTTREGKLVAAGGGASIVVPRASRPRPWNTVSGIQEKLALLRERLTERPQAVFAHARVPPFVDQIKEQTNVLIQLLLGSLEPLGNIAVYLKLDEFFATFDFEALGTRCIGFEDFLPKVQYRIIGILKDLDEYTLKKLHETLFSEVGSLTLKGLREIAGMARAFKMLEEVGRRQEWTVSVDLIDDRILSFGAMHLLNEEYHEEAFYLLSLVSERFFYRSIVAYLYIPLSFEGNRPYRDKFFPVLLKWFSKRKYFVRSGDLAQIIEKDPKTEVV